MLKESFHYLSWWLAVKVVLLSLYLSVPGKLISNNTWMHWIRKDSFRAVTCFSSYSTHSTEIRQTGCRRVVCAWKSSPAHSPFLPSLFHLPFRLLSLWLGNCSVYRRQKGRGEGLIPWLKRAQQLLNCSPGSWIERSPSAQWCRQLSLLCSLAVQDLTQISP